MAGGERQLSDLAHGKLPMDHPRFVNDPSDAAGVTSPASNIAVTSTLVSGAKSGFAFWHSSGLRTGRCLRIGNRDSGLNVVGSTGLHVFGGKFRDNAGLGVCEASGTGNNLVGVDLSGNTLCTHQISSAVLTSYVTA